MGWVQRNIQSFGGDPNKITIFGESAGSASIACHLVMPNSKGMFNGAIMESGPYVDWTSTTLAFAEYNFNSIATNVNCSNATNILNCMQQVNMNILLSASSNVTWRPVVDRVEILQDPQVLAASGKFSNNVPVLLGTNLNEGSIFLWQNPSIPKNLTAKQYTKFIENLFGNFSFQVLNLYPVSAYPNAWAALEAVYTHYSFRCPNRRSARWLSNAGLSVYEYVYEHVLQEIVWLKLNFGVFHGSEIPFVFMNLRSVFGTTLYYLLTPQEWALSYMVSSYWANFVKTGNPNSALTPTWPPYLAKSDLSMSLADTFYVAIGQDKIWCDFWDTYYYQRSEQTTHLLNLNFEN